MKWLFALLVALNIIVFSAMVASRVAESQKTVVAAAPISDGQHELALPPALRNENKPQAQVISTPDWIATPPASDTKGDTPAQAESKAKEEKAQKEKEKQAQEKADKARTEKEKQRQAQTTASNDTPTFPTVAHRQCYATASITILEDDYYRLKGLISQWPYAATRIVEQRKSKSKPKTRTVKTYRVLVPSNGDIMGQLNALSAKGFGGDINNGEISISVEDSKSAAQVVMSRLASSGISGAHVREESRKISNNDNDSLSVAKMQLLFTSVDDKAAQGIQSILGRYGKLKRNKCR